MSRKQQNAHWPILLFFLLPIIGIVGKIFPALVKLVANKLLQKIPGYFGEVDKINIELFSGRCFINQFFLNKIHDADIIQFPFFAAQQIDIKINRRKLLKGVVALNVKAYSAEFTFVRANNQEHVEHLHRPLRINIPYCIENFEVLEGIIGYEDSKQNPLRILQATGIHIMGMGLSNIADPDIILPSELYIEGKAYGGIVKGNLKLNVTAPAPTFDLNLEITGVQLHTLNRFFMAYGNFTIHEGNLSLFTEIAANGGKFKGYVKPLINDLAMLGPESNGFWSRLREALIGAVAEIFENHFEEQIASKIPFNGTFKKVDVHIGYAIMETLKNAFISALKPSIDFEININSIKG